MATSLFTLLLALPNVVLSMHFGSNHIHDRHRLGRRHNLGLLHSHGGPHPIALESKRSSPTLLPGWSYLGCYSDPSASRLLATQLVSSSTPPMTQQLCVSLCNAENYFYAGVEYGVQCWCGNTLNNPKALGSSSCNMPCQGDSSQACGASSVIGVLHASVLASNAPATYLGCFKDQNARTFAGASFTNVAGMSNPVCNALCANAGFAYAGTEYGSQCYCGNSAPTTALSSSSCATGCAGGSGTCGGGWALSAYKLGANSQTSTSTTTTTTTTTARATTSSSSTSTTTTSAPGSTASSSSVISLGCYQDQPARALNGPSTSDSTNMTPAFCQAFCASKGTYVYFGVEYRQECYCGNSLTATPLTASNCVATCTGDTNQICGGTNYEISVFQVVTTTSPASSTSSKATSLTTTTTSSISTTTAAPSPTATLLGCYQDQSTRTLNGASIVDGTLMTIEYCQSFCYSKRYTYFGLEYQQECYCGNTLSSTLLPAADCTASCAGNPAEICGGLNWEVSVYRIGAASSSSASVSSPSSTATTTTSTAPVPAPTYDATCNSNLVMYWGQNSYGAANTNDTPNWQQPLSYYCHSGSSADVFTLSFLDVFFGQGGDPEINLSNICSDYSGTFSGTDLANCQFMANDIQSCQAAGKLVTLSIGGAISTQSFTNDAQAQSFADQIWNLFLGGSSTTRPFGSAVLDGINLDIESGTQSFTAFVNQLQSHYSGASKKYYMTAAPQCPYPDASLGATINAVSFDAIYVQFYNNPGCGLNAATDGSYGFNFGIWDSWASTVSPNKKVKVFIGAPASSSAAGSGYVSSSTMQTIIQQTRKGWSSFGGISLWDASQAYMNGHYDVTSKAALVSGGSCGATFVPQACTASAFSSATPYTLGMMATYGGVQYYARWWTMSAPLPTSDNQAWSPMFACK